MKTDKKDLSGGAESHRQRQLKFELLGARSWSRGDREQSAVLFQRFLDLIFQGQ